MLIYNPKKKLFNIAKIGTISIIFLTSAYTLANTLNSELSAEKPNSDYKEKVSVNENIGKITVAESSNDIVIEEKENGFCSVDGSIDNNNPGFNGSGFANTDNAIGKTIVWHVRLDAASSFMAEWRYANGSGTNRIGTISVNGVVQGDVNFPTSGSWSSWTATSAVIDLSSGDNTIVLKAKTNEGLSNIDSLTFQGAGNTSLRPGNCEDDDDPVDDNPTETDDRYRLMWSSDFPPIPVTNSDPDDVQSIIRLLLYSNELDIEGFIASAGTYSMVANKKNYTTVLDAYEKVYDNLKAHDNRYPTPDSLRGITYEGKGNNNGVSIQWGCGKQSADVLIGSGLSSEGSNAIIATADKPDSRPLWIGVAGGGREVAQAIWDVRNTRSEAEAAEFISKLRVFLIACQDGTHDYLMDVPGLFVIESRNTYNAFFCDGSSNCNTDWVNNNIINNHGPLGAIYPPKGCCINGVQEGDTPAFMHLISANRGINNPENPAEAGWGGQYKLSSDNKWIDSSGQKIRSDRQTIQNEFAERADWMIK